VYGLKRKVHFVGVGGIGMSGLAEVLLNLGYEVSGTDLAASEITDRLQTYGLRFHEGHDAAHLDGAEILVISAAVPQDNPEVLAARTAGLPVIHRSDLLADLMRMKPHAVAVGGTHGKTTTTSMISAFLDLANIGATSIVGGILHRSGTNARWGTGEYLVAEADEHDGSFLRLHPTIAVVTNIDAEHLEYYGTLDRIQRAFADFCNDVPFYGCAIVCGDDPNVRATLGDIDSVCLTYGFGEDVSLQALALRPWRARQSSRTPASPQWSGLGMEFDVVNRDERFGRVGPLGTLRLNVVGRHNALNALAACAVGLSLGMRFGLVAEGLAAFDGVRRRMQVRGTRRGVTVLEDYAHHPTEIASTLEALRWGDAKRIVGVFQPHLYSRTKFFCDNFAEVLATLDRAIVTDIYPSREAPMPGVDAGMIVDIARASGASHVELVRDMHTVPARLAPWLEAGDVVVVLGAGNINTIVGPLLDAVGAA
jgi:UDP-N-acetylmuramate--alanine ligase